MLDTLQLTVVSQELCIEDVCRWEIHLLVYSGCLWVNTPMTAPAVKILAQIISVRRPVCSQDLLLHINNARKDTVVC